MNDDSLGSITLQFQLLQQQGDSESANQIWQRYFPRLLGLAKKVLAGRNLPAGAEDAVQEAFFQFFKSVASGGYDSRLKRDDLWRILSMITVQKARKQLGRESALKRGSGTVKLESQLGPSGSPSFRLDEAVLAMPTAEWDLVCSEMLERLNVPLREIALMRLAGYTNPQIKEKLDCSLRSVERKVQIIRTTWEEYYVNHG